MIRVGLDMDDVLYDWMGTAKYLGRTHLGIEFPPIRSWGHIEDVFGPDGWKWLWTKGVDLGLFRHGHMHKGAADAVLRLSQISDVLIVTHRPRAAVVDTLNWLAHHRFEVPEVHILVHKQPKSSVPCDIYVDDALHNAEEIRANRPDALMLLWKRSHNEGFRVPAGAVSIDNWLPVMRAVEDEEYRDALRRVNRE